MVVHTEGEISTCNRSIVDSKLQAFAASRCTAIEKEGRLSTSTRVKDYYSLVAEFMVFLRERKSYWLAPVVFVLLLLSALAFFLEGSVLAPAIYSVF